VPFHLLLLLVGQLDLAKTVRALLVVEEQRTKKTNDAHGVMVLRHACRGVLRTTRVPFSALLFCTRQALGETGRCTLVALYVKLTPHPLSRTPRYSKGTPRPTTYTHHLSVLSAQVVDPLGLRDSPAADRRRENDEPVSAGSIAGESREAQAAARARAHETTGQLLASESLLPLR